MNHTLILFQLMKNYTEASLNKNKSNVNSMQLHKVFKKKFME